MDKRSNFGYCLLINNILQQGRASALPINNKDMTKQYVPQFKLQRTSSKLEEIKVTCSEDAHKFALNFYDSDIDIYESMFMILLNRKNMIIGWVKISQGGTNATVCDTKLVAKFAVEALAEGVILVHNHPSGYTDPSPSDDQVTAKVRDGLRLLDIQLFDHIVISADSYFSYADEGRL